MKPVFGLFAGIAVVAGLGSFAASAQSVISAKSGLIHYVEGRALLGDQLVEPLAGNFPEVKENAQLRTEDGRAEVLLTPGVVLRVGESSAIRMITNRLIDTRVEFLSGTALVEASDLLKDNSVTMVYQDYTVRLLKKGLYRFDSEPAQLRVYDGQAQVESGGKTVAVDEGRMLPFNGDMAVTKFDTKDGDSLYRWAKRRSEYLAMANVSAARSVSNSMGSFQGSSGWVWNPYYSMFTFVPMSGMYYSPFGYAYWSPYTVYRAFYYYNPTVVPGGGGRMGAVSPVTSSSRPINMAPRGSGMITAGGGSRGSIGISAPAASVSRGAGMSTSTRGGK
jgi:hypothetical protein